MSLASVRVKIIAVKYFVSIYFWGKLHPMSFETTKFLDAFLLECLSCSNVALIRMFCVSIHMCCFKRMFIDIYTYTYMIVHKLD